jgi:hypothetical protein
MIQLIKGQDKNVIITLTEKTTIPVGYYLFQFIHETTKEQILFTKNFSEDLSIFTYRYNKFLFQSSLFVNHSIGKYVYNIFETSTNTTDISGLNMVETGKMDFNNSSAFEFTQYSADTNYTQYAG